MSGSLRVLVPGLATTVQDLGRPGYAHLGVPASGALDPVGLRAANALVGNPPDAGALEVVHMGPTLAIDAASVRLGFAGAGASIDICSGSDPCQRRPIDAMRSVRLSRDDIVSMAVRAARFFTLELKAGLQSSPCSAAYRPTPAAAWADGRDEH